MVHVLFVMYAIMNFWPFDLFGLQLIFWLFIAASSAADDFGDVRLVFALERGANWGFLRFFLEKDSKRSRNDL